MSKIAFLWYPSFNFNELSSDLAIKTELEEAPGKT